MAIMVKAEMSNRHVHLSKEDIRALFGEDSALSVHRMLGKEEFAANECVSIEGASGLKLEGLRVLGPAREKTQVELLRGDCRRLGIDAPVTESVSDGSAAAVKIIGPAGTVTQNAAIIAKRHVHIPVSRGEELGISNGDLVELVVPGERGLVFRNVVARLHKGVMEVIHLDIEEANAAGISNGDLLELIKPN